MTPRLSIFTPTSNRAESLRRLYESLSTQTWREDFEWLVVDDGSTDFTRQLIESFMRENRIRIRYIYKEYGGCLSAWLTAITEIDTELCVCISPDRFMPDDAVELILRKWDSEGSDRYGGVTGLIFDLDSDRPIGGWLPDDMASCWPGYVEAYGIHRGEMCTAVRTRLLKDSPIPSDFTDERLTDPAPLLLTQLFDRYPLLVINRNLCFAEQRLTSFETEAERSAKRYISSPRSFAAIFSQQMALRHSSTTSRLHAAIGYVAYSLIARDSGWLSRSPRRLLTLLVIPAGYLLSLRITRLANPRR